MNTVDINVGDNRYRVTYSGSIDVQRVGEVVCFAAASNDFKVQEVKEIPTPQKLLQFLQEVERLGPYGYCERMQQRLYLDKSLGGSKVRAGYD